MKKKIPVRKPRELKPKMVTLVLGKTKFTLGEHKLYYREDIPTMFCMEVDIFFPHKEIKDIVGYKLPPFYTAVTTVAEHDVPMSKYIQSAIKIFHGQPQKEISAIETMESEGFNLDLMFTYMLTGVKIEVEAQFYTKPKHELQEVIKVVDRFRKRPGVVGINFAKTDFYITEHRFYYDIQPHALMMSVTIKVSDQLYSDQIIIDFAFDESIEDVRMRDPEMAEYVTDAVKKFENKPNKELLAVKFLKAEKFDFMPFIDYVVRTILIEIQWR